MQVFISYKSEYRSFAERLRDRLRGWGFSTWLDVDNIREGSYWRDEIDTGLKTSDVVVGVLTPEALDSREVKAELDYAVTSRKRLLLLKYRDVSLPYWLANLQHVDFTPGEDEGFARLRKALADPAAEPVAVAPPQPQTATPTRTESTNRDRMLQKVHDFWVVGVLENALRESGAFDLGLQAAPGAVLRHVDYGDYTLPTSANIADVFTDLNRELLILGAPGAGKTILLLQLARDLIQRAQADEKLPIPVVFNLSSWAAERKPLADWLADELRLKYQVPRKVAKEWVEREQLLLLLDGLDEVAEQYRNACVDAINTFRQHYRSVDLAVCSRIADYDLLTSKLDLRGAITLQPLSQPQIDNYLNRDDLSGLREVMQTDATLQDMAGTPFLLNTMAYAYRGESAVSLQAPASPDPAISRRTHLFDRYVEKRLQGDGRYTPRQTRHYLSWLARKMIGHPTGVFYIEGMQPQLLELQTLRRNYSLLIVIVFTAYFAIYGSFSIHYITTGNINFGLVIAIGILIWTIWIIGSQVRKSEEVVEGLAPIKTMEIVHWSWSGMVITYRPKNRSQKLILGSLGTLSLLYLINSINDYGVKQGVANWLSSVIVLVITLGIFGIPNGMQLDTVEIRNQPNDGIWKSLMTALTVSSVIALTMITAQVIVYFLSNNCESISCVLPRTGDIVFSGLAVGSFYGVLFGGSPVIQHTILRFILYRSGDIPWNYARFLDFCAERTLLRKVGGGYIFIHRYLLDYFAELEG